MNCRRRTSSWSSATTGNPYSVDSIQRNFLNGSRTTAWASSGRKTFSEVGLMKAAVRWKPFPEAARIIESGLVIVEGQTEESFVSGPLAEALALRQVYLTPIILGVPGHKGGRTNYDRVRKDILKQLKQDRQAYCTTMLDFYGLGPGFPGRPAPASLSSLAEVQRVDGAMRDDSCSQVAD